MSFFIKSKSKNNMINNSFDRNRKRKAAPKARQTEDVTSSEDEGVGNDNIADATSSEDENETAQEKKLRLAKVYLQEIERVEKKKLENQELDDACNGDIIQQRLKEDYLKQAGKLRLKVANKYIGTTTENTVLKCKEHNKSCTTLCVSNDGKFVFSGSKDGSVVKWSLDERKKLSSLSFIKKNTPEKINGHSHPILAIAISHDFKFLVIGDESSNIQIWNPVDLKHIHTLKGHIKAVTCLVFRKDTHTLYSASKDKSIKVWSLDEMSYIESLYGHMDAVTNIDALSRERVITSGGRDTSIRIWKIVEETHLVYNGHSGSIDCVKLINEENFISGGDDGSLSIWGVNKKKPLCIVKDAHGIDTSSGQANWIVSVATLVNTDLVASGSCNGEIYIWELGDSCKTITKKFSVTLTGYINSMSFTSNGEYLIAAVGTEHKYGRWNVIKSAKNSIVIIPLLKK